MIPLTAIGTWINSERTICSGNITTSNYDAVVDTVEGSIIGGQIIQVELQEKKLAGAPQHNHFTYSEAPEDLAVEEK